MKVTFKRPLYITLELSDNVDRQKVTTAFRNVIEPEFLDFVSSIRVRKSVLLQIEQVIGQSVEVHFSDSHQVVKRAASGVLPDLDGIE